MIDSAKHYEFADFRIDAVNKVLRKNGELIPLTPKVFDTLMILLENAGNLVEKNDLMQKIWRDSFVEESNLTFNIKMLRKALGDSANNPKFIETIPRRGYRFIAEVSELDRKNQPKSSLNSESFLNFNKSKLVGIILLITVICSIVYAAFFWNNQHFQANAPIFSKEYKSTKLSETGKVFHSAVSPDGKLIAYTSKAGDKESIWLRQLETGVNTELISPVEEFCYGLRFSRDGNTLFFTRLNSNKSISLYKISIFGGVPQKIVDNTQGWVSFSNDGKRIAFVRYDEGVHERNKLIIADLDGKNESLVRESEFQKVFSAFDFSPDDKTIAVAYGRANTGSQEMLLVEVDVQTGEIKEISPKNFFDIKSVNWMPNKSGLLISAGEKINEASLIWKVDYPNGKATLLRNDTMSFFDLNLDQNATKLAGVAVIPDFHLFTSNINTPNDLKELAQARDGLSFTSDRRIVFASDLAGPEDIWIMNADGSSKKQLTTDKDLDAFPLVSEDNRYIYFTSNRTGQLQIWRMNLDGTEQIQITKNVGGFPLLATADGKNLYYQRAEDYGIWQFSLENGQETLVIEKKSSIFCAFSSDGSKLAFLARNKDNNTYRIDVMNVANKQIIKTFALEKRQAYYLNWLKNDDSLTYLTDENPEKVSFWKQKLKAEKPELITTFSNNDISFCQFLPDEQNFAVILGQWKHDAYLIEGLR